MPQVISPYLDSSNRSSDDTLVDIPPKATRLSHLSFLKLVGTGGSSQVYLVKVASSSRPVALKVIKKHGRSKDSLNSVINELSAHAHVPDDFFAPLLASFHDTVNFYLITEYVPGGDLAMELIRCKRFDASRSQFYAAEILIAIEALHFRGIVHRDIKPANILLRRDGHLVLTDFGYARYLSRGESTTEICGTPLFMCPEQHLGRAYAFDSDFWALGVVIFRMVTGEMPWSGDDIATRIGTEPIPFPTNFDEPFKQIISLLLNKSRAQRPSNGWELKKHGYFQGVSWDLHVGRNNPTLWLPWCASTPKNAKCFVPFPYGHEYDAKEDPYPDFTYTREKPITILEEGRLSCWWELGWLMSGFRSLYAHAGSRTIA